MSRTKPNILITGTPGSGKSSTCRALIESVPTLRHIEISELVKEKGWHNGFDEERQSFIIDEDKVCDELEDVLAPGGAVIDTHAMIDYFPERWFDLVIVLQTDNTLLYDRLAKRGYEKKKIEENVQCEIMQVLLQEARDSYQAELVQVLASNNPEELESNVERISQWYQAWCNNNSAD